MAEYTPPEERLRSRRSLLAAAAGGAAAIAAGAFRPRVAQAASVAVMTEVDNVTEEATSITNVVPGGTTFVARATGDGDALVASSVSGTGMLGWSADTSDPENNVRNAGVVGVAGNQSAIAENTSLSGVYGYSDPSPVEGFVGAGVWGDSADFGVIGTGGVGVLGDGTWGVRGFTAEAAGIGVYATAATGRALRVEGRAEFTRSGRTTISSGASTKKITLAGCTTSTLVIAVLASNRSGRYVRAVVPAAGSFTVYLNTAVTSPTFVVWMAFTNPSNHSG